jgi:hypothetical protein
MVQLNHGAVGRRPTVNDHIVQMDNLTIVQLGHLVYFNMIQMDHGPTVTVETMENHGDHGDHGKAASSKPIKDRKQYYDGYHRPTVTVKTVETMAKPILENQ